ncbi:glyoxalase/bleomycin resistance protein/dioxygenase superfamily protein 21 [Auriscalpium vulgare]|uniref:Glyoxalase/bleomycin resistance protein/dioxygenase superfamily protein 21 n=1 Tax=Auriscalpium vulgare TaxID=40419 RepID=A0ACB8RRS3_9AGAM|nr:glyoxalase/bleomycin resistance protein/dioxygenase superfamily protein 21 [Auriscalpium vulgare]
MSYYDTNPKRLDLLGHLSFGVQSIAVSQPFYTAVFATLGLSLVYQDNAEKPRALGYGWGARSPVNIYEEAKAAAAGAGTHIGFNAPSRKAVDEFYRAALEHGKKDDGAPGLRKDYHDNDYACFVYDPDGHRLEAVYQQPLEE